MRAALIALGSAGDVHPFIGIGQALLARGHAVTVYTNPVFMPLVEEAGLGFEPVGTEAAFRSAMGDPALWHPRTSLRRLWSAMAVDVGPLFHRLTRRLDPHTVMLGSLWAFGARLVQEKFDVPYLSAQVSPSTLLSAEAPPVHPRFRLPGAMPVAARRLAIGLIERAVLDRTMGPALNQLRRGLGLAPVQRILGRWMHSPQGVLGLFPEAFAPRQRDWPAPYTACGFPLFDAAEDGAMDEDLRGFLDAGRPPVIVTPGSGAPHGPRFFATALAVLQRTGQRGVLLGADAMHLPDLPSTVRARAYVPLSRLLPHARALWHHGGIGTSAFGLAAARPQLVTPFAHDQFDNAARLQRLGVALPARRGGDPSSVDELAHRLGELLGHAGVPDRCRAFQRQLESPDRARARVVRALEQLHAQRPALHIDPEPAHVPA